jgi:hypothetical protein
VFAALSGEVRNSDEQESIIPLVVLSNALSDLDDGVPSGLFEVARKVGRRRDGFSVNMLKVSSAATVDLLHEQGRSIADSANLVAGWLDRAGARTALGHRITTDTVISWREQTRRMVKSKNETETFLCGAYHDLSSFSGKDLAQQDRLRADFVRHVKLYAPYLIRRRKNPDKSPGKLGHTRP